MLGGNPGVHPDHSQEDQFSLPLMRFKQERGSDASGSD